VEVEEGERQMTESKEGSEGGGGKGRGRIGKDKPTLNLKFWIRPCLRGV